MAVSKIPQVINSI